MNFPNFKLSNFNKINFFFQYLNGMKLSKYFFMAFSILSFIKTAYCQTDFNTYTPYNGNDLGVTYTPQKTTFKVWSPSVIGMQLKLYDNGLDGDAYESITFEKQKNNVWAAVVKGDLKNKFYTYQGYESFAPPPIKYNEVPDIYAKAVGVNGKRGMVVDITKTNPAGWSTDRSPFNGGLNDAIIYELHVRDATIYSSAKNKGKFLGLTENGLKNSKGQAVGLDHIKNLGVTHVQLLPCYDFFTVDESIKDNSQYNWGYDPLNYNVPEGSYSTNPYDGNVRIKEFKTLVQTLHKNNLAVIMDVVYNHTMFGNESYFNQLVPNYYYRQDAKGAFSNASGCGNETASDRTMYRKFMIESVVHWVKEYHIDGFRFDLMAIHDIETMNIIATTLRKIKPNIILLGEGWTSGASPLPDEKKALKKNAYKMNNVAVFSDDIRDGIKGSVFNHKDSGFVSGKKNDKMSVQFGLVGAINHPNIDFTKVNYSKESYTKQPYQMIAYNECHDNHTLWDRLLNSHPNDSDGVRQDRYKLAMAIVLTSQGVPFIHAGQEFCRTKQGEENSYKSSDTINAMDWERMQAYATVQQKLKELIKIRQEHPAFRLGNAKLVQQHLSFVQEKDGIIHIVIKNAPKDTWKEIHIFYNGTPQAYNPKLNWKAMQTVYFTSESPIVEKQIIEPLSCKILVKNKIEKN
jgi:pullulanase